ncbi:hypothetical protein [Cloacibacillus porcorum]
MDSGINSGLSFDFALKGALSEGTGSAMFFAETEGELTLGSSAAFAADSVWRGNRAKQSNTPSVSPQKRRRSTFDVATSRIAQIRRTPIWLPGRLREEGFKKKPLFIIGRVKAKPQFTAFFHF